MAQAAYIYAMEDTQETIEDRILAFTQGLITMNTEATVLKFYCSDCKSTTYIYKRYHDVSITERLDATFIRNNNESYVDFGCGGSETDWDNASEITYHCGSCGRCIKDKDGLEIVDDDELGKFLMGQNNIIS